MPNADYTYTVAFKGDVTSLRSSIDQFSTNLKSKPLVIPATTSFANTKIGDAENIQKMVKASATALDTITTKYGTFYNELGKIERKQLEVTKTWVSATGQVLTKTEDLTAKTGGIPATWKAISTEVAKVNLGELAAGAKAVSEKVDSMAESAKKFIASSANMSGKPVDAAKQLAEAVLRAKAKYDEFVAAGNMVSAGKAAQGVENLTKKFELAEAAIKQAANANKSWGASLTGAIKQTIAYATSLGLIRMVQRQVAEGIKYVIELNKEMVKIQVLQAEGAQTPEEINNLAIAYNNLAKQMGVTTIEVAQGSVEWLRQGKTIAETTELLKASTMLSKLGNLSAAESTEYLTSTINSYKMASEDAVSIVDKLVAVDNQSATSTMELATALRYSAATADQAGVSLEQLISYIGVISSVTRMNAESIGQAMKTMLTRMQDIKAGKIDEDGLGINNVESALSRVDIKLRDSATSFRDLGSVLEEIAGKWGTLNEIEQANIGKAIAGVRQANMFMVLMTNMNKALELQKIQFNASGIALDRYKIYLEGVEAAQNKLKASVEGLWQDAVQSGAVTAVINLGIVLVNLLDILGGMPTLIGAITAGVIAYKWATLGAAAATTVLQALTPFGWVALAVGAVVALGGAVNFLTGELDRNTKSYQSSYQAVQDNVAAYKALTSEKRAAQDLIGQMEATEKKLLNGERVTTEERAKYLAIQTKLKDMFPTLSGFWDKEMQFHVDTKTVAQEILKIEEDKLEVIKAQNAEANKQYIIDLAKLATTKKEEVDRLAADEAAKKQSWLGKVQETPGLAEIGIDNSKSVNKSRQEFVAASEALNKGEKDYEGYIQGAIAVVGQLPDALRPAVQTFITSGIFKGISAEIAQRIKEGIVQATADVKGSAEEDSKGRRINSAPGEGRSHFIPKVEDAETISTALSEIYDRLTAINDINSKLKEDGFLSAKDIATAVSLGLELENVNGVLTITPKALDKAAESAYRDSEAYQALTPEMKGLVDAAVAETIATDAVVQKNNELIASMDILKTALQDVESRTNAIKSAMQEMADTGSLSNDTVINLVSSHAELAKYLTMVNGKWQLDIASALRDAQADVINTQAKYALIYATQTAAINTGKLTQLELEAAKAAIIDAAAQKILAQALLNMISAMNSLPAMSGGGGGGGGKSAGQIRIENEIKALEKKKKKLQENLEEFKKYIEAQKLALKLAREQDKFDDSMLKKQMSLAKLKARIAVLALDDSEEATAERLKLLEEESELELEIAEDKEDRKYELQIQALEKVQEAFEDMIDRQIEKLDEMIAILQDQLSTMTSSIGNSLGGAVQTFKETVSAFFLEVSALLAGKGIEVNATIASYIKYFEGLGLKADDVANRISRMIASMQGLSASMQGQADKAKADAAKENAPPVDNTYSGSNSGGGSGGNAYVVHGGGLIESHHDGEFAGNLKSNEVFAKLLKGEYVATEGQMSNFMGNILPKMSNTPTVEPVGRGDTQVSMPISVAGNLDKSVLPDLEKLVNKSMEKMNNTLMTRGYKRAVDQVL